MGTCKNCGQKGLLLKVTAGGLCLNCAEKRIDNLEKVLTPEMERIVDVQQAYQCLVEEKEKLEAQLEREQAKLIEVQNKYRVRSKELIQLDDVLEMESFSLYRPKFDFVNSEQYKVQLEEIRESQKKMIRDKTAAVCHTVWSVEGSKTKGRAFANEMIKLFLRSFNNECDIAVQMVKFNNFDRCVARIEKSFETINSLGKVNTVELSAAYKQLKLAELTLAYEYQRKRQEEKEALAELRAQQREEAKLAKEIEAARKEAEKERKHYIQALEKLKVQMVNCQDAERAALMEKQTELLNHIDDISVKLEDIDYRQSNQRAGYVYIISNIGSFGENVYKIGMTRRLDPMERIYELGDASVPFQFDVHALIFSDDAPKLEAALHQAFADKRVNQVNTRREYFRVSLDDIIAVVKKNHDKTVEFTHVAEAQQYRESCKM